MMTGIQQDLRYALRGFAKTPAFALVAVGSIALGIGANAAIFRLLDQLLLKPLPVAQPERTVMLEVPGGGIGFFTGDRAFSNVAYRELKAKSDSFEQLVAEYHDQANLNVRGQSETVPVALVSGNYFGGLGLRASVGRVLTASDDVQRNGHPVVVLSHGYFVRRFGGDAGIVGQTVRVNGKPYQVVGVGPQEFVGMKVNRVASLYVPLAQKTEITTTWDGMEDPNYFFLNVYGVLREGVTRERAKANLDSLLQPIVEGELKAFPALPERVRNRMLAKRMVVWPAGRPVLNREEVMRSALYVLMGMVGLVLVIACANVANLLLARASGRAREMAIRVALGAGRGHLTRQMVVESLLLSVAGGAVGLVLSIWILDGILWLQRGNAGVEYFLETRPDWRLALYCFGVSSVVGLLFGVLPTVKRAGDGLVERMKGQGLVRAGLVVAQVTLSLVLLVAAGLFAKSLWKLRTADPGFRTDSLLSFKVDPSLNGYSNERAVAFFDRFSEQLGAVPGVQSVTVAEAALLENRVSTMTFAIEGYERKEGVNTNARVNTVGAGYFQTMGIPLLQGREFTRGDVANGRRVAVVNEVFARDFFGGKALGKRLGVGMREERRQQLEIEIVGIVKDGKSQNLRETEPARFVYTPYSQTEGLQGMTYYLRASGKPEALTSEVQRVLRQLDENLALYRVQTMATTMDQSLELERTLAVLCSAFGLMATLLAAIGLYGVMAYNVARRTREIGIRMALGAERGRVMGMVMREVGGLVGVGLLLGVPAALALGRVVEAQLWGVKGWDAWVVAGAAGLMLAVALGAGWLPAWRASRVSPMTALRYE